MAAPDTQLMAEARAAVEQATKVEVMDDWALLAVVARLQAVVEKFIEVAESGDVR
ncbi:hypothetical protein [Streptomyces sp. NPDC057115]|uniref:hypothetical protein n=1 Tax=Streptomyces sp. NPDC057115 TaxID=3346022 RepID=UPI0036391533